MKIIIEEAYKGENGEVLVKDIRNNRVSYVDVTGWSYGWPYEGQSHSTTIEKFKEDYPEHIQYAQPF